jgi:stage V sporulation protein SpoVS
MTMVACRILLTAVLMLFRIYSTSMVTAAQPSQAGQNPEAQNNAPRVENAKVETRSVAGRLAATFTNAEKNAVGATWIGYSVKAVAGQRTVCCGNYSDGNGERCAKCELERNQDHSSDGKVHGGTSSGTVKLEGGEQLTVLFRLQSKRVTRISMASEDCVLDAGGLPLIWLEDVKPAESVALLTGYVRADNTGEREKGSISNEALSAIALHDGHAAEVALESFVVPGRPEELRKQASFWMGAARGTEGFAVLQRMAKSDPSTEVRAHVAFALSITKESGALEEMIRMAHEDASGHVRGQAIFWLAQKAGKRAVGAIDSAIENDPDTDVKKQAVFALSQLPKDEGVPKLILVAETNHNPVVRKQAMFWLGQSQDVRALEFFEKVLTQ